MSVQRVRITTYTPTVAGAVSRIRLVGQSVTGPVDTTATTALAAHLADTTDAHDASAVSVLDAGGNYTATDVEGALAELPGTYVAKALADAKGDLIVGTAADTVARLAVGANGAVPLADSTATTGIGWVGGPLPFAPAMVTGRYYRSAMSTSTAAPSVGNEHAVPLFIGKPVTLDRIGVNVSVTAGSSVVRLGIRSDNNGLPGTLVLDAGTVDSASSTGDKFITISQALTPGWYWLCAVSQGGAPTLSILVGGNPMISGTVSSPGFSGNQNAYYQTGVTGALGTWAATAGYNYGITVVVRVA